MNLDLLLPELSLKAIRSSGSGGQHVNKVSSKVELQFNIETSKVLSNKQKARLYKSLKTRLTKDKILILQCDETRSQHTNKMLVIQRFIDLITKGLKVPKKRKPTKAPKSAVKKRLKAKQIQSERKASRKKPNVE